jgi:large subunit ribosomal protein L6
MSRIGKAPIEIPAGVTVNVNNNVVTVKGPKGELSQAVNPEFEIKVEEGHIQINRPSDDREHRAQHGLYRALVHNMVVGVSTGYRKEMELVGVGYRAASTGQVLDTLYISNFPTKLRLKQKPSVTRTPLLSSKATTNNFSVKFVPRFVHSANLNLTRVKVLSSSVK